MQSNRAYHGRAGRRVETTRSRGAAGAGVGVGAGPAGVTPDTAKLFYKSSEMMKIVGQLTAFSPRVWRALGLVDGRGRLHGRQLGTGAGAI